MFRKTYLTLLLTALVFTLASAAAFGQTAPVRGVVKLEKTDGTVVPVADAIVQAFRTDIDRGKMPDSKTNKRGEFQFVGFPYGQVYVLSVSGPGIGPQITPGVKAGMENIVITVREGDGRQLTEAEARQAEKGAIDAPTGELTEEQKRQEAENARKIAEMQASNKKAEDSNKIINAAVKAGADAFNAKNYDLAIAEYDKGIQAAPDFVGSAPTFLGNKGLAHQKRAIAAYNTALSGDAAAKAAAVEKMKPDFAAALAAFERGLTILKNEPTDPANQQKRAVLLANAVETHGFAARLAPDPTRDALAAGILEKYIPVETDEARRTSIVLSYANNMNGAGELKSAAVAYRKVLEVAPDNLDAIAGLGLALYSIGYDPPDKATLQEGLNYMQKFVDAAPDTHQLKQSVK
jgi:tetratricopeptide (TPR) repeat protein